MSSRPPRGEPGPRRTGHRGANAGREWCERPGHRHSGFAVNGYRAELARLLGRSSPSRRLLRQRVEVFVSLGVVLGALHLVASRSGGDHVAITALLGALVPVFAPVCFVPVVFADRQRGHAPVATMAARLSVVAGLGWVVASVHLLVWELLASATGSISGPTAGDVPFMVVAVAVTAVVASVAYQAPVQHRWAQPTTVVAVVALYVASFVIHGLILTPSLSTVRHKLGAGPESIEAAMTLAALAAVWLLMRREVSDGTRKAGSVSAVTSDAGPARAAGP